MIPLFKVFMADDAPREVERVLRSGFIGQGPETAVFESEFVHYAPMPVVATNSCTSAIELVLRFINLRPGQEVITTPLTCVATNAPIVQRGARPVWADVDEQTGLIDVDDVERKITPRTAAIIAVDWTGRQPDYSRLRQLGPFVIQDAAHGPLLDVGRPHGHAVCYSFGPIKHLTSVEGGAVAYHDPAPLRLLRWYGLDRTSSQDFRCEQDIKHPGMKWHMNDVNAAIGRANLRHLHENVALHRANARRLYEGITNPRFYIAPWDEVSNYWVFPMLCVGASRDIFKQYMQANGIAASQVHARNDKHSGYHYPNGPLLGVEAFDAEQVNIPCGWWLTSDDVDRIIERVNAWRA